MPETPTVLITAHGDQRRERARLAAAGKRLVDTTCPLVTRVHQAARALAATGLSRPGDRPAGACRGAGDRRGPGPVRGRRRREDDVRDVSARRGWGSSARPRRRPARPRRIREAIAAREPRRRGPIRRHGLPARRRSTSGSLERLLDRVDAMVVVGGRNSNNTRELVAPAASAGVPALHVQGRRRPRPGLVRRRRGRRPDRRDLDARRDDRRGPSGPAGDAGGSPSLAGERRRGGRGRAEEGGGAIGRSRSVSAAEPHGASDRAGTPSLGPLLK